MDNPTHPDALFMVEKIKALQKQLLKFKDKRIDDLRLAMNYSRYRGAYLTSFQCMLMQKEAIAISRAKTDDTPTEYIIPPKIDLKVQIALKKAFDEDYQKTYDH